MATAFQITTGTKTWFIKIADDDKDEILFNWVSAIQGAIAHLKQGTLSPPIARSLELRHHSIAGRDFVMDSRYTELKYVLIGGCSIGASRSSRLPNADAMSESIQPTC